MMFEVFGRDVEVRRSGSAWQVYYCGNEGKRRPATDIVIPPDIQEGELITWLADLCHEWARPGYPDVTLKRS